MTTNDVQSMDDLRNALALFDAFHEALIDYIEIAMDGPAMENIHKEFDKILAQSKDHLTVYDFFTAFQEVIGKSMTEKLEGMEKLEIMALKRQVKVPRRSRKGSVSVSA